ncbi:hypothetical protein OSB04_024560 [Centaurea solstitialis]|uniref:Reverse transcriptase Ty1/copia-type domain-containing protein n=1 Tax=Centaurea solstitialis TaxID=347529 RepID=A0AA38T5U4_9ASTR|nr:hypothetical protein OSB04_024560 [Centaurea solstitialis]
MTELLRVVTEPLPTVTGPTIAKPILEVPIQTSTSVPTESSDPNNTTDPTSVPSANIPEPSEVSHEVIHEDLNLSQSLEEITSSINLPQIIEDLTDGVKTRAKVNYSLFACFVTKIGPKTVTEALANPFWIEAMQDKLLQFERNNVWTLTLLPNGKVVIGTNWVFCNKKDENGVVIRNMARLVAQGYCQEEGIDYDNIFFLEDIRIFLAYATHRGFKVDHMDVKSAFLNGKLKEEMYVKQPSVFENKVLYGLKPAPRAWYERLSTFLLSHNFHRRITDITLFYKKQDDDILLVQVYVDDIIFGSTNTSMSKELESLMQSELQMSMMGELTFFLGLQVKPCSKGISINQARYVQGLLK